MGEPTPQTEALTSKLLESDDNIAAFKSDPKPMLDEHGVELTAEQHSELTEHLAGHDVSALKMSLSNTGLHTMFSQQS